jgi:glycosyltransferase involved in cell wall biosynthesis
VDLPTISVILPTRDRPEYLVEAIRSVSAQQPPPDEVLVVDDGPTRSAAQVLRLLAAASSAPIELIPGPGKGPAAARNLGIRWARGQLIALLDDDDLWLPGKLLRQAECLVQRPEVGLLGTLCVRARRPPADHPPLRRAPPPRYVPLAALLRANRFALSSVVIRKECLDGCGGFDESLPLAQDWDLWLRVAARWSVALLPARLTVYRLHPGQRSQDQAAMRAWEGEVVRRALARGGSSWPLQAAARRRLSWAHYRLGRALLKRGDAGTAWPELKEALSLSPLHPLVWGSLARCALAVRSLAGVVEP